MWQFAIELYSAHKTELLHWQDNKGANVNDLLALAYASRHKEALPNHWWLSPALSKVRALVVRSRAIRKNLSGEPYQQAKQFELELEGLDIQLLSSLLKTGDIYLSIKHYAEFIGIDENALNHFIESLTLPSKL